MKKLPIAMAAILFFGTANTQAQEYSATESSKFALKIYKEFAVEDNDNIFFSPFSLSQALGMTYAGANGQTKQQIAEVFNFPLNDKSFHKQMGALQNQLIGKSQKGVEVAVANQLWADKNYKFKCTYKRGVSKNYNAPVKRVDFYAKPEECRLEINKWVEHQTRDRIKDLLPNGSITPLTTLVLTNAIYFKGQWESEFEVENTADEIFITLSGEKVNCSMMNSLGKLNIYQGDDLKMLELPYRGKEFSMLVLLPNEGMSFNDMEKKITEENLSRYIDLLTQDEVRLSFPKFKFDAEYALKPVLSRMGMPIPFSNSADFSGMSRKKDLKIDEVFHKAFVEVSEEGTEAAAATAVVIVRKSVTIPVEFNANRPFMFIIRENSTGTILFMGRVTNPNT